MKSVYLTVGHSVKGVPTFSTGEVCAYVRDYLHVEAFTAITCLGMWEGNAEESTRIEICALTDSETETIRENVSILAQALAQDSIMFQAFEDQPQFIESETIQAVQNL